MVLTLKGAHALASPGAVMTYHHTIDEIMDRYHEAFMRASEGETGLYTAFLNEDEGLHPVALNIDCPTNVGLNPGDCLWDLDAWDDYHDVRPFWALYAS